jgi:cytochrome c oxidase subunit 2
MLQSIAWQVTTIGVVALLAVFSYVALNASSKAESAAEKVSRSRGWVFWILLAAFVPIIAYSLIDLPYTAPGDRSGVPIVVKATGHQWRWEIEPSVIPAGRPVEFHVTSEDVNHGFALYGPDLKVVAQTQAMPGYTNVLHVRFERPGEYRVLCLEYCGLAHHKMMSSLTITESN